MTSCSSHGTGAPGRAQHSPGGMVLPPWEVGQEGRARPQHPGEEPKGRPGRRELSEPFPDREARPPGTSSGQHSLSSVSTRSLPAKQQQGEKKQLTGRRVWDRSSSGGGWGQSQEPPEGKSFSTDAPSDVS